MWSSITEILRPTSLGEAVKMHHPQGSVWHAGGTYLVAAQSASTSTIIEIRKLLDQTVVPQKKQIMIGAGTTVQDLINTFRTDDRILLAGCAQRSCWSRNIRQQRTIGGEIAQGRPNSELLALLYLLNVKLKVMNDQESLISIRDWAGQGLITQVIIELAGLTRPILHRFALLVSTPPFVITGGMKRNDEIELVIAGDASEITSLSVSDSNFTDSLIADLSRKTALNFKADHLGSQDYKQTVIRTGLKRIRASL